MFPPQSSSHRDRSSTFYPQPYRRTASRNSLEHSRSSSPPKTTSAASSPRTTGNNNNSSSSISCPPRMLEMRQRPSHADSDDDDNDNDTDSSNHHPSSRSLDSLHTKSKPSSSSLAPSSLLLLDTVLHIPAVVGDTVGIHMIDCDRDDESCIDNNNNNNNSHQEKHNGCCAAAVRKRKARKWASRKRVRNVMCSILVLVSIYVAFTITFSDSSSSSSRSSIGSNDKEQQHQHKVDTTGNNALVQRKKKHNNNNNNNYPNEDNKNILTSTTSKDTAAAAGQGKQSTKTAMDVSKSSSSWFWPWQQQPQPFSSNNNNNNNAATTKNSKKPPSKPSSPLKPISPSSKQQQQLPKKQSLAQKQQPPQQRQSLPRHKKQGDVPLVPYKYSPGPPSPTTNVSARFVERWCDLTGHRGSKPVEWYPKGTLLWQRRSPAFLIPGAKYSGVPELAALLSHHPQIVPPRRISSQVQFFLDFHFKRYVNAKEVTRVYTARQRMYAQAHLYPTKLLARDKNRISFDATPGYLLYSAVTPRRIFCVAPWVKLIILLQDPIDRLIRHYWYAQQHHGLKLDFQTWVEKDLAVLSRVQLTNQTAGSAEEDVAWYEYTTATLEGAVGRSIYEIQLRHWFQAIMAIGKRPNRHVLLLRAEDVIQQPDAYYRTILHFLGLNHTAIPFPMSLSTTTTNNNNNNNSTGNNSNNNKRLLLDTIPPEMQEQKNNVMTPEFRSRLMEFYKPYQQRLPKTLDHFVMDYAKPMK